jgi:ribonucleoside-diphosphate reductase alpha chain
MYETDQSNFIALYNKVEQDTAIPKKFVSARDLAIKMLTESEETGRQYWHRTDELNRHTPFKDKIYSSNLC